MVLAPTPEGVSSVSFTSLTEWRSKASLPQVAPRVCVQDGVLIHYRSTGVIRSVSASMSLREIVDVSSLDPIRRLKSGICSSVCCRISSRGPFRTRPGMLLRTMWLLPQRPGAAIWS
ncbi:hypothetical protein BDN71DRAFT_1442680 [Pleurotus eryngii]|uniref:Uncharacterized protein n=1 Tax=Pleurotus eryngii TaxID=5323 RepID=A0A9P6DAC3_PLEER|nr:hypothetical protein BDN71DRAFT_1442680 [Pleurotus eryngii]